MYFQALLSLRDQQGLQFPLSVKKSVEDLFCIFMGMVVLVSTVSEQNSSGPGFTV